MATSDKSDYWYYISWFGVAIILVYAILKSFNIIHSPTYQEMLPLFGGAITFGGMITAVRNLGTELKEFKTETKNEIREIRAELKEIRENVSHLDKDVEILKDMQNRN